MVEIVLGVLAEQCPQGGRGLSALPLLSKTVGSTTIGWCTKSFWQHLFTKRRQNDALVLGLLNIRRSKGKAIRSIA